MGYQVWIAVNDVSRSYARGKFGDGCASTLSANLTGRPGADAVRLIDVQWLDAAGTNANDREVIAAFGVEHPTSIYSGIVRMLDLALGTPDRRQRDVMGQLRRPAFSRVQDLGVRYLPRGELEHH